MSNKDLEFLKAHVLSREAARQERQQEVPQVVPDATRQIEDLTADEKSASIRQRRLHRRALRADAADMRHEQDEERQEREEAGEEREDAAREKANAGRPVVARIASTAGDNAGKLADRVGGLPTPVGNGLLIALLAILLFTVVQVNVAGDTRLKQFWYMLNGRATIRGRANVVEGSINTSVPTTSATQPQPTTTQLDVGAQRTVFTEF